MPDLIRTDTIELEFNEYFFQWSITFQITKHPSLEMQLLCMGWEL